MSMRRGDFLPAGNLTRRITISAPTYNAAGDERTGDAPVAVNVPAERIDTRGDEVQAADRTVSVGFTVFRIRYRSGLDTANRVTDAGEEFNVRHIANVNGSNRVLEMTCEKTV